MFLNLLPHVCTRCLLWRHALRLASAYPLALLQLTPTLAPQEAPHD